MESPNIKEIVLHFLKMSKSNDEIVKNGSLSILANITEVLERM